MEEPRGRVDLEKASTPLEDRDPDDLTWKEARTLIIILKDRVAQLSSNQHRHKRPRLETTVADP